MWSLKSKFLFTNVSITFQIYCMNINSKQRQGTIISQPWEEVYQCVESCLTRFFSSVWVERSHVEDFLHDSHWDMQTRENRMLRRASHGFILKTTLPLPWTRKMNVTVLGGSVKTSLKKDRPAPPPRQRVGWTLLSNSYGDLKEATWWLNPRQASCWRAPGVRPQEACCWGAPSAAPSGRCPSGCASGSWTSRWLSGSARRTWHSVSGVLALCWTRFQLTGPSVKKKKQGVLRFYLPRTTTFVQICFFSNSTSKNIFQFLQHFLNLMHIFIFLKFDWQWNKQRFVSAAGFFFFFTSLIRLTRAFWSKATASAHWCRWSWYLMQSCRTWVVSSLSRHTLLGDVWPLSTPVKSQMQTKCRNTVQDLIIIVISFAQDVAEVTFLVF